MLSVKLPKQAINSSVLDELKIPIFNCTRGWYPQPLHCLRVNCIRFYWNIVTLICLHTVYGYFHSTRAELNCFPRHSPQNLKYLLIGPLQKKFTTFLLLHTMRYHRQHMTSPRTLSKIHELSFCQPRCRLLGLLMLKHKCTPKALQSSRINPEVAKAKHKRLSLPPTRVIPFPLPSLVNHVNPKRLPLSPSKHGFTCIKYVVESRGWRRHPYGIYSSPIPLSQNHLRSSSLSKHPFPREFCHLN